MSACRSCGKAVTWVVTARGKRMPAEDDVANGNLAVAGSEGLDVRVQVVMSGAGTMVSHFARCGQAEEWRR